MLSRPAFLRASIGPATDTELATDVLHGGERNSQCASCLCLGQGEVASQCGEVDGERSPALVNDMALSCLSPGKQEDVGGGSEH
eukprot:754763-Hanusia_phi.AAC.1